METLNVKHLTKYYGVQCVLDDVSFELRQGQITGFLGPNGAGKTTTMNIITGYLQNWDGSVSILGKNIRENSLAIRRNIGYLPEHNPLDEQMYVREYLECIARHYLPREEIKNAVQNVIEKVELGKEQHKKIGQLSKGYKQRVGLAQALVHQPKILILDEPTTGLDPNQLKVIRKLIRQESQDKIVLFSTHIMQEVEAMCDRTLILNQGKLVSDSKGYSYAQVVKVAFAENVDNLTLPFEAKTEKRGNCEFVVYSNDKEDIRPLLFRYATSNNLTLLTLNKEEQDITAYFSEITK